MLRRSIDAGLPIAILEVDAQIVAAQRVESLGCRYARCTDLVVHPNHRGRGYHTALIPRGAEARRALGLGQVGEASPSMDVARTTAKHAVSTAGVHWSPSYRVLRLATRRRFPGQGHLLRALYTLGGRRTRRGSATTRR
jgi:GNAT superfamily N-acetyltransferase